MKKLRIPIIHLIISSLLIMIGCAKPPEEDPHPEWDEAWIRFGDVLAAETVEDFELNESSDVMSIAGLWYATWTSGEGEEIVNSQGRDAVVYDAQIYLLLKEGNTERGAEADFADWIHREKEAYETSESSVTVCEREYKLLHLESSRDGNPYHHGEAAFTIFGSNIVTAELLVKDGFVGDTLAILLDFLNHLHY